MTAETKDVCPPTCPKCGSPTQYLVDDACARYECDSRWLSDKHNPLEQSDRCQLLCTQQKLAESERERDAAKFLLSTIADAPLRLEVVTQERDAALRERDGSLSNTFIQQWRQRAAAAEAKLAEAERKLAAVNQIIAPWVKRPPDTDAADGCAADDLMAIVSVLTTPAEKET